MKQIIKCYTGSKLYGCDTPDSDSDYCGIYHKDIKYILGLETQDQMQENTNKNSANTKDDSDFNNYSLHEFFRLAIKNNPNILELFFISKDKIIEETPEYDYIKSLKDLFISRRIFDSFLGYATAQRKLLTTKTERLMCLNNIKVYLDNIKDKILSQENVDHLSTLQYGYKNKHGEVRKYLVNQPIEQIQVHIDKEINAYGKRKDNIVKYGYETKFASQLIRLMYEGIELAETRNITFPLKHASIILEIKQGKITFEDVLDLYDKLLTDFRKLEENNNLQAKPRFDEINDILISITKKRIIQDK